MEAALGPDDIEERLIEFVALFTPALKLADRRCPINHSTIQQLIMNLLKKGWLKIRNPIYGGF
jgi:hypothetical protein